MTKNTCFSLRYVRGPSLWFRSIRSNTAHSGKHSVPLPRRLAAWWRRYTPGFVSMNETPANGNGGLNTAELQCLKEVERENRDLHRSNDILHQVSAYFAKVNFGQEVIDRRRATRPISCGKTKGAKGHQTQSPDIVTPPENLPEGHNVKLAELPETTRPLNTVYTLKTALKEFVVCAGQEVAQKRGNER